MTASPEREEGDSATRPLTPITKHEIAWQTVRLVQLASQLSPARDLLYTDFRYDIAYQTAQKLTNYGITWETLLKWQKRLPLVAPWNVSYDNLRMVVNRIANAFPLFIVMAATEDHVISAFKLIRKYKLPFRVRSGSHDFEALSVSEGVIIDQSRRTEISYDVTTKCITFQAGTLLGPLADQLTTLKRGMSAGTCPDNGASMYVIGGGIGLLIRKYGMACDSLVAAKMVIADGQYIEVDQDAPDLLWALRGGGGGNFGIVTEITLKTYPLTRLTRYQLVWPAADFIRVATTWQNWYSKLDHNTGGHLRLFGSATGKVVVYGVSMEDIPTTQEILAPLLALKPPTSTIERGSFADAARAFAGTGRWLPFFKAKNILLDQLLTPTQLTKLAQGMAAAGPADAASLEGVGGRANEVAGVATAYPHRAAWCWLLLNYHWSDSSESTAKQTAVRELYNSVTAGLEKKVYVNAKDLELKSPLTNYYGANLPKLLQIKQLYDPENVFAFPQGLSESIIKSM